MEFCAMLFGLLITMKDIKNAYLMQATCKISDSKMEKIKNFKERE